MTPDTAPSYVHSETESGMVGVGWGLGSCCLNEHRGSVWENGKAPEGVA